MYLPALIPSPSRSQWFLGPLALRAYALAIIVGIVVAWWMATRRYVERGGQAATMLDITFWAVPFGIVGGRIYHVISSPDVYFGQGGHPLQALAIWQGGLGIWGAIALGGFGVWLGARRAGVRVAPLLDSLAPALLVAQGIGRLGNWFNQELYGGPTTLPWGLKLSDANTAQAGYEPGTLFHPTFAYELIWNFLAAAALILIDRRHRQRHGRLFALYMMFYTFGRVWIELLRIDQAHTIAGLRLNVWTSIVVALGALTAYIIIGRRHGNLPDLIDRVAFMPDTTTENQDQDQDQDSRLENDQTEDSETADALAQTDQPADSD